MHRVRRPALLRAAGARRGAAGARGGAAPTSSCEDINKLPLFLAGMTDAAVLRDHPAPVREHGVRGGGLADGGDGMARGAADCRGPTAAPGSTRSARARGTTWWRAGWTAHRIRVIHPGVDCVRYRPDPAVGRTADPTFVYVGRLKRYKGVDLAIRALALARQERPELSPRHRRRRATTWTTLQAAGPARLGQADAVRFLGFVTEEEKLRLFRSAWANVFPSPKEGWGITVMEAAACGTPSIASDSPGLRDSVRAGDDRMAGAAWRRRRRWRRQYLALAGDRGLVDRFGVAARQHAERLTWDAAADQTEAQLQDLIKRHRLPLTQGGFVQTTVTARHCEISELLQRARQHHRRPGRARSRSGRSAAPSSSTCEGTPVTGGTPPARCAR